MSGSVSFNTIPPNLQVPLFWVETSNAQAGIGTQQQRVLIVGGTLNAMPLAPVWAPPPAGSGAAGAAQAVAAQAGSGSMLASMVGHYRLNDPFSELWFLPVADPSGGAAATGTTVITGTATAAGTISDYIGGHLVSCAVSVGQAAATVATNLAAAANAISTLPVTAAAASGTVTYTTRHKGTSQNQLDHRLNYAGAPAGEATPAGLTISVTGFSGASGVPDLSGVAAALGNQEFDFIVSGFNDSTSLAALTSLMSDTAGRWSYLSQLYGGTFTASIDTATNLLTLGGGRNDQHQCIIGAAGSPTPFWKVAAAVMGVTVPRIIAQPNIPLDGLAVAGVQAPAIGNGFSLSTQQSLLTTGISPLTWDRTGTCRITRLVSTYQTNSYGVPDQSYLDIGTLYTNMAVLRRLRAGTIARCSQKLLVDDGTPIAAGQPAVSPRTERIALYHDYLAMQNETLVEDADGFLRDLVVTRNATNPGRIDVLAAPRIVGGLHIYALLNQFRLRAGSLQIATAA